jgi:predicted benzoate:H+ symporter BenE
VKKAQEFFRANPQAFLLLVICVVLGIGSFLAIVISLASSGGHNTGQPEGLVRAVQTAAGIARGAAVA